MQPHIGQDGRPCSHNPIKQRRVGPDGNKPHPHPQKQPRIGQDDDNLVHTDEKDHESHHN